MPEYYRLAFRLFAKIPAREDSAELTFEDVVARFERGTRLEEGLRAKLEAVFLESRLEATTAADEAERIYSRFSRVPAVLASIASAVLRIFGEDRLHSSAQEALFKDLCCTFRFEEHVITRLTHGDEPRGRAGESSPQPLTILQALRILGCDRSATPAEVRKAYRRHVLRYHPDAHAAKRASGAALEEVSTTFGEIQRAYEALKNGGRV